MSKLGETPATPLEGDGPPRTPEPPGSRLVERTQNFLDDLLTAASNPIDDNADEGQVWTVRDKLALVSAITNFLGFTAKYEPDSPGESPFKRLKNDLRN